MMLFAAGFAVGVIVGAILGVMWLTIKTARLMRRTYNSVIGRVAPNR